MFDFQMEIHPLPSLYNQQINAEIILGKETHIISIESNGVPLINGLETWLSIALLPAMIKKCSYIGEGSVSRRLYNSISIIQNIYKRWYPNIHLIELARLSPTIQKISPGKRKGCFFSGGVDSWYTFLQHQDEITDLIFVHGFDIPDSEKVFYKKARERIEIIAQSYNKNLVEIRTNLRSFTDLFTPWTWVLGAAMAGIGHALSGYLNKIYFAAPHTYAELISSGSHPLLDPLWSSESIEFIHDGCEANRIEKIHTISKSQLAMETLRVCWENREGKYNCGKCEKCLRTMIELQAAGALDKCTTFKKPIDLSRVRRIPITTQSLKFYTENNLHVLRNQPENRELYKALLQAKEYTLRKERLLQLVKSISGLFKEILPQGHAFFKGLLKWRRRPSPSRQYWMSRSEVDEQSKNHNQSNSDYS